MANRDLKLLNELLGASSTEEGLIAKANRKFESEYKPNQAVDLQRLEHPLDSNVIERLNSLKSTFRGTDNDFQIFNNIESIKELWKIIISKSIKCLRYFDLREPFLVLPNKHPVAYGVNELSVYFEEYSKFESMLYGSGKYYRDHVIHVLRVWLLGLKCLLDKDADYLNRIAIQDDIKVSSLEKISIWSIVALTHDLGYPLEKAQEIIDRTKNMMKSFVSNPIVSMDLAFNGVQNNMNDFVIRFMSSRMHVMNSVCPIDASDSSTNESKTVDIDIINDKNIESKKYVARLQPKYYFKLQKSLEQCKHGILSSIIIYKLLIYFLESDFNINEDYQFDEEDARQFYIRREILRSIASHTCRDIYHLTILSFAYLLIIADDAQEWGRKRLSELYVTRNYDYTFKDITTQFDVSTSKQGIKVHECTVSEQFKFPEEDSELDGVTQVLQSLQEQYEGYKEIFRDGQDTAKRNFVFIKKCTINSEKTRNPKYDVEFKISNDDHSEFKIRFSSTDTARDKKDLGKQFLEKVYGENRVITSGKAKKDGVTFILKEKDSDE